MVNTVSGDSAGPIIQARDIHGGVTVWYETRPPVQLPHRAGLVPPQARGFQERRVARQLASDSATSVLSGMGGVGKTQLAAHHAEHQWATGAVELLVWVTATSREAVVSDYARLAADLTGVADQDPGDGARRLLEWLAGNGSRWLVVLDDVRSAADLTDLWPPQTQSGQTVVTTRRRDAALHGAGRQVVEVGLFTPAEAHAYLRERLELADDVEGLAQDLGFLPLALAQAAAYLLDRQLPCSEYRRRFARRRLAAVVPEHAGLPDGHRETVATTWALSVELANQLAPAGLAEPVLQLTAGLDPNGIPAALFTSDAVRAHLSTVLGHEVDQDDARDALTCLHRLNLVTYQPGETQRAVRVHALVQRATWDQLEPPLRATVARHAADGLTEIWPEIEKDTALGQALRANALALQDSAGADLFWPDAHLLLFTIAVSLSAAGLVSAAGEQSRHLRDFTNRHLGPDHPTTLTARSHFANCRGHAGDPAGAVTLLTDLVADRLRILGPDHLGTLSARQDLALWRGEAGNAAGAVGAFEELLVDQLRVFGPDHPNTLRTRHNLALWRGEAGDPAGAATAYADLLADRLRRLGPDHPETLTVRGDLSACRGQAGDAAGAAAACGTLLADQLRILGPDHPGTLATRHNLAYWRGEAGDAAGAIAAFEELLVDQLRVLGPDHPSTFNTRGCLACERGNTGDLAGTLTAFEELLADQQRVLGPDHPDTLSIRGKLAVQRGEAGDPAGALTMLEELLADQVRVLGPDHPGTLHCRSDLAACRGSTGDTAGAAIAWEQVLADHLRVLGPDHPDTLLTRGNLALVCGERGDWTSAVTAYENLLTDHLRVLGPDHPKTLLTRHNLAFCRGEAGDPAGALATFEALLADRLRVLGPDHPNTLASRHNLAFWQAKAGQLGDAVTAFAELLADRLRVLGPDHPDTIRTRDNLAYCQRKRDES